MQVIGYQYIDNAGYTLGNVEPTLAQAWAKSEFSASGKFYEVLLTPTGGVVIRYHSSKQPY